MPRRDALFLISPDHMAEADFHAIAERVRRLAPDVGCGVWVAGRSQLRGRLRQLLRPTLLIEMAPVYRGHLRGRVLRCGVGGKIPSLTRLQAAGLPVPKWVEVTPGLSLDPAEWGSYVVVKPSRGRRGAYVWMHRTTRVRYKPPESYPEDHPGRRGPMLAQRFVYTGRWPSSYRVTSLLGEPLSAYRFDGTRAQAPLESPEGFGEGTGGRSIVAAARSSTVTLAPEQDLLDLARRIHAALPETPLLGIDLMRDAATGALWIAEVNSSYCWVLSSESGREMQRQFGLDLQAQYGWYDRAAEAVVRATRALAI